jgi:hypothetical protein
MDKINEICRKISSLRSEMLALEVAIRDQIQSRRGLFRVFPLPDWNGGQLVALIGERNVLGGYEPMLNVEERLKADLPGRSLARWPSGSNASLECSL